MAKLSVDKALLKATSYTKKGEIVEAENLYRTVLQMYPNNKRAQKGLVALNKFSQSTSRQDPPREIINQLVNLYNQNQLAEVIEQATPLTKQYPKAFIVWNILGTAAAQTGKLEKAINSFEKAISLKPNYAEAHNNFGNALKEQGRLEEAIEAFNKALLLKPDFAEAYRNIGNAFKDVKFNHSSPEIHKTIISLLDQKSSVRPKDIAAAVISLLKLEPNLQKYFREPNIGKTLQSLQQAIFELSDLSLLLKLMSVCPLPDLELEKLLKQIRAGILLAFPSYDETSDFLKFQTALALQCFNNEYIYDQSKDEEKAIANLEVSLETSLAKGKQPNPQDILCLASYKPLYKYRWCCLLADNEHIHQVFIRQINEPLKEQELKTNIRILKKITDDISIKVSAQYESHPYPRWIRLGLPLNPKPISKIFATSKLKLFDTEVCKVSYPSILVAGCGTGQHPISTAARFRNSQVIAVDLSLSSLAYAQRKTEELGIKNIEYIRSDILNLKKLDKQFDIIESVGVLHHMNDPMAGWKALVDCLKDGGVMKIGLYSELARKQIVEIRNEISRLGIGSSDAEMRSFRQALIEPERDCFEEIRYSSNFYSLSELRDLLFHIQEHRFDIPQINECLDKLGLKFCGFNKKAAVQKFRQSNNEPKDLYDLYKWQRFEEANPDTFAGMYQFWCQKTV